MSDIAAPGAINQGETVKPVKRKTFNGFVFMQNYIGF